MKSSSGRVLAVVGALVLAIVLFTVLRGDGEDDPAPRADAPDAKPGRESKKPDKQAPQRPAGPPTIVFRDGEPVGGVRELSFEEGDRVRFEVVADVSDHVHVHGYDVMVDVAPGSPALVDFPATIEGIFEAEMESQGVEIVELRVAP